MKPADAWLIAMVGCFGFFALSVAHQNWLAVGGWMVATAFAKALARRNG